MPHRRTTIDAIRGICLVNIFVNHIQDGYFSCLSPSRLGFSDSSDVFVLLSGMSTVLAVRRTGPSQLPVLVAQFWRRAARVYAFAMIIVLATLGVLGIALILRDAQGISSHPGHLLREYGLSSLLWHGLTLRQTVGYSSVLRLYVVLMLLAPVLVRLADWRIWAPLPPALLLWALAGHFGLVVTNSLSGEPFSMTILPWILLFTIGIVLGQALKHGIALPRSGLLAALALGYLAAYLVFAVIVARLWPAALDWAATRNDHFWLGASKTYQSPLRLLHVLALAYVVMALPSAPVVRLLHAIPRDHVLTRLGRHSLVVFTCGAIGVVAANEVLDMAGLLLNDAWLPMLLLEAGAIAAFVALALHIDRYRSRRAARRAVPEGRINRSPPGARPNPHGPGMPVEIGALAPELPIAAGA